MREWCLEVPEIVNISVNTPYPGTETGCTEARRLATRDYRLFDIQHAVLPTKLPLPEFYAELVETQQVLNSQASRGGRASGRGPGSRTAPARGQTNFLKMLWKFNSVYDPQHADGGPRAPVRYEISLPPEPRAKVDPMRALRPQEPGPARPSNRQCHRAMVDLAHGRGRLAARARSPSPTGSARGDHRDPAARGHCFPAICEYLDAALVIPVLPIMPTSSFVLGVW